MAPLCHPWFTTTNLSYRFPVLKLQPPPCAVLLVLTYIHISVFADPSRYILDHTHKDTHTHHPFLWHSNVCLPITQLCPSDSTETRCNYFQALAQYWGNLGANLGNYFGAFLLQLLGTALWLTFLFSHVAWRLRSKSRCQASSQRARRGMKHNSKICGLRR